MKKNDIGVSTAKGHRANQGTGVFDIGGEAVRAGTVEPGEEKPRGETYQCVQKMDGEE